MPSVPVYLAPFQWLLGTGSPGNFPVCPFAFTMNQGPKSPRTTIQCSVFGHDGTLLQGSFPRVACYRVVMADSDTGKRIGLPQITDEDLVASGPSVRALLVGRLERLWRPVEFALNAHDEGLGPVDPRLLEIGLRVIKDEAALYRLARPPVLGDESGEPELGAGVDRRALVMGQLEEREARLRGPDGGTST